MTKKTSYDLRHAQDTKAANRIEELETYVGEMGDIIIRLERRLNEQENFGQHD